MVAKNGETIKKEEIKNEDKFKFLIKKWQESNNTTVDTSKIDECFEKFIEKIKEKQLTLTEYANIVGENDDKSYSYFCHFIETKTAQYYGSAFAGKAQYFGIKRNKDDSKNNKEQKTTYYIAQNFTENREAIEKADEDKAKEVFAKKLLPALKQVVELKVTGNNFTENNIVEDNFISSKVMLRKIVAMKNKGYFLYIYSNNAIDAIYDFFVGDSDSKSNLTYLEKNFKATQIIKNIFSNQNNSTWCNKDMIKLSKFIWSIFGSNISLESKNMILYGAPGTGKTYSILNIGVNIVEELLVTVEV